MTISFFILAIYAILLLKEVVFFSLFLLLGEIRRVLSGKMGISVTKITKIFNINSFPGIDWHREVIKVIVLSQFHDLLVENRHLNSNTKHCAWGELVSTN